VGRGAAARLVPANAGVRDDFPDALQRLGESQRESRL
jgi:hypothetical protein